ncbi:hypothetical protein B0J13DRAFT_576415 [Dactylonectria estremocensis]|uniref:Uncharacterized protein n=1 Tax=Dactylonectria estremocensis TaxID=1079267 RepID=A0A9P9CXC1_9HYPO|nr:hypothetical protein B0J13DRAFT_579543 [Dactylonectria estremocensis]KAH7111971.1 hypothetical protein B0J13DRAFT_576415 [Dactylonectria estremocensis]
MAQTAKYIRLTKNPELASKLEQIARRLFPLVELDQGLVHPSFPQTVLGFWLLTDKQLESLAQFYHQKSPNQYTDLYPYKITWRHNMSREEKRCEMGKFIGLPARDLCIQQKSDEEIRAEARRAGLAAEYDKQQRKLYYCGP